MSSPAPASPIAPPRSMAGCRLPWLKRLVTRPLANGRMNSTAASPFASSSSGQANGSVQRPDMGGALGSLEVADRLGLAQAFPASPERARAGLQDAPQAHAPAHLPTGLRARGACRPVECSSPTASTAGAERLGRSMAQSAARHRSACRFSRARARRQRWRRHDHAWSADDARPAFRSAGGRSGDRRGPPRTPPVTAHPGRRRPARSGERMDPPNLLPDVAVDAPRPIAIANAKTRDAHSPNRMILLVCPSMSRSEATDPSMRARIAAASPAPRRRGGLDRPCARRRREQTTPCAMPGLRGTASRMRQ